MSPDTPKPDRHGFPRSVRIRQGREFALVRRVGRSTQGKLMRLSVAPQSGETRFGLITSRRVGGAVIRNRTRRRLREICRLHRRQVLPDHLVVVVAKPAAATATYEELRDEWLLLARRLSILAGS